MGDPIDGDWKYYPGADGTPTNDTDPFGGAITTGGGELNEDTLNGCLLASIALPASGTTSYYGGAYRKLTSTLPSSSANTRVYNRNGAILNTLSGQPRIVSTSPLDAGTLGNAAGVGLQVRLVSKVSSLFVAQYLNINGTTFSSDVAGGVLTIDASSSYRWEACLNGSPTTFYGDVGCFIGSQLVAVIRGSLNPRRGIPGRGNLMCSAETSIAVATTKSTTVSSSNRLNPPASGITAFAQGVFFASSANWAGSDQSLALPSDPYVPDDYFFYCLKFDAIAGIIAPLGPFQADIGIICNPGS
jgi:hypothetical protein